MYYIRENSMKKESLQKLVLLFAPLALTAIGLISYYKTPHVVINEVCSNNYAAKSNENSQYSDYIELYNPGKTAVSLDGCFLTDDAKDLEKYSLEGISIPANGYTLIWLDKDSEFRISKDGEKLFLTDTLHSTYLDLSHIPI